MLTKMLTNCSELHAQEVTRQSYGHFTRCFRAVCVNIGIWGAVASRPRSLMARVSTSAKGYPYDWRTDKSSDATIED
jgi:hypothetical protein